MKHTAAATAMHLLSGTRRGMSFEERQHVHSAKDSRQGLKLWHSVVKLPEFPVDPARTALIVIDLTLQQASRHHGICRRIAENGRADDLAYLRAGEGDICCSPPLGLSFPGSCPRRSFQRGNNWYIRSMSPATAFRSTRERLPISKHS